jgi:hypothetical protein
MVEAWGLPSFFLNLTADEVSETRWREIDDMEKILKRLNRTFTWQDAPIECAALFHARIQAFMKEHILDDKGGVLGKVLHYEIMYEEQGRGSLHAHIILWVDPNDVERVTNEISATPAEFDEVSGEFIPSSDPNLCALFGMVTQKNQHVCRPDGCLKDRGYCKYGFSISYLTLMFKLPSMLPAGDGITSGCEMSIETRLHTIPSS